MTQQESDISILAGNFRVSRDQHGKILIDKQLNAFDAALRLARQCLNNGHALPKLSVAFDHHGIFRLQFLAENLSNTQKRRPRLSHLHPSIQQIFLPITEKYQIALSDIHAIHEDSARQHLAHTLATEAIPERLARRMQASDEQIRACVRFGLGRFNSEDEIRDVCLRLETVVKRLRSMTPRAFDTTTSYMWG